MNESNDIKHIGVFTSGGDSPGMNAALYATAKACQRHGVKLSGIRKGYEGMIDGDIVSLDLAGLRGCMNRGGTMLKTARSERFRTVEGRKMALDQLVRAEIDGLIAIGGDGTFNGLLAFSDISSLPCIGIPGTIDNDLTGTDFTLGFDSAVNTAIDCIDKIRDTAESHDRVFVVEVMGRDSGYIAIHAGLGAGADSILIPESVEDSRSVLEKIKQFASEEAFIIVVSEGDEIGAESIATEIQKVNPAVDLRVIKLRHVQRGGSPTASDRILGIGTAVFAVESLLQGKSMAMAGSIANEMKLTTFSEVVKMHSVDPGLQHLFELFNTPKQ